MDKCEVPDVYLRRDSNGKVFSPEFPGSPGPPGHGESNVSWEWQYKTYQAVSSCGEGVGRRQGNWSINKLANDISIMFQTE